MLKRVELTRFLENYFKPFSDLANSRETLLNGLQIRGKETVAKIGLGVSASLEFFEKAKNQGCDFLITHHGLSFPNPVEFKNTYPEYFEKRLKFLYRNEISLAGFHFMLDHHPEIGNNAWVLKELGADLKDNVIDKWGWFGKLKSPAKISELLEKCEAIYSHKPFIAGILEDRLISTVAVVSGSGSLDSRTSSHLREFIDNGIELQIVGDMRESHPALAKELGITIAAFGHYNTEIIGVRNLGQIIRDEFKSVEVVFVDVPNLL